MRREKTLDLLVSRANVVIKEPEVDAPEDAAAEADVSSAAEAAEKSDPKAE